VKGFRASLRGWRFWLVLALFLLSVLFNYPELVPPFATAIGSFPGPEGYALERFLFLAPVVLAGFFFGLTAGLVCLGVALGAMLPRVFSLFPSIGGPLFEMGAVTVTGALANWVLESRRREAGEREQALIRLRTIRGELRSYIQSIRDNEKRLSLLHSVTTVINQSVTLEEILDTAAVKIKQAVGVDAILVFLVNERAGELELKTCQGVSKGFAGKVNRLKIGEGFNGWVARTGESCFIEDSSIDPRLSRDIVRKEGLKSQFVVPLESREKVVGTLSVATRSIRYFTKDERELLMLIGTELGVAVEKAELYEESQRIGAMFRELFEKAHDAIWVHDFDGKILAANRGDSELAGFQLEELTGENVSKFLSPEGLELAREVRRRLLSGEEVKQPYEQRIIRKDGAEAIVMLTTSVVNYEGTRAFQNIARDVTSERQLQENLRSYVHQITRAHEEERKRIARELHDDTIQALVALSRRVDDLASSDAKEPGVMAELDGIGEELDEIQARVRRFIQDLRPPTLEYLGLLPALRELVSQLKQQANIEAKLHVKGTGQQFAPERELLTYRIIQEALTNIGKHSGASLAEVTIEFGTNRATITISDNGRGFEVKEDSGFIQAGRIGLAGMQERAELLNGSLAILSRPGQGTKLVLEIPANTVEK